MGSKTTKTTSKTELDPQSKRLNELRLQQEERMSPVRMAAVGRMENYLNPTNVLPGMSDPSMSSLYSSIPGLSDLRFGDPNEAFAASRLAGLTDMTSLQNAYQQNFDKIVSPKLNAQLIAQGLGRSGALAQATGDYMTTLAPTMVGQQRSAESQLASYIDALSGRRLQLNSQLSDPSRMSFMSAPTTTQTTKSGGGGGPLDYIIPIASIIAAPFTGGASLMAGGMLSGILNATGVTGGGGTAPTMGAWSQGAQGRYGLS